MAHREKRIILLLLLLYKTRRFLKHYNNDNKKKWLKFKLFYLVLWGYNFQRSLVVINSYCKNPIIICYISKKYINLTMIIIIIDISKL